MKFICLSCKKQYDIENETLILKGYIKCKCGSRAIIEPKCDMILTDNLGRLMFIDHKTGGIRRLNIKDLQD